VKGTPAHDLHDREVFTLDPFIRRFLSKWSKGPARAKVLPEQQGRESSKSSAGREEIAHRKGPCRTSASRARWSVFSPSWPHGSPAILVPIWEGLRVRFLGIPLPWRTNLTARPPSQAFTVVRPRRRGPPNTTGWEIPMCRSRSSSTRFSMSYFMMKVIAKQSKEEITIVAGMVSAQAQAISPATCQRTLLTRSAAPAPITAVLMI